MDKYEWIRTLVKEREKQVNAELIAQQVSLQKQNVLADHGKRLWMELADGIAEAVKTDQALRSAQPAQEIDFKQGEGIAEIRKLQSPTVVLRCEWREMISVVCCTFTRQEYNDCEETQKVLTLKLVADENLQVNFHCNGRKFFKTSDVCEFLLTPVLRGHLPERQ